MEHKKRSYGNYLMGTAAAIICSGLAAAFVYEAKQNESLRDELIKSEASTAQIAAGYKKLDEAVSKLYTTGTNMSTKLQQCISQTAKEKSDLESKITMTNEELAKLSKERYDQLDAQQKRTMDYDTYKSTFKQSKVYSDDKKKVIEEKTITIYDHDLMPDKKAYCAMTDDAIIKARTEYIQANSIKEIPRPPPPPPPPPPDHHYGGGPRNGEGPCR